MHGNVVIYKSRLKMNNCSFTIIMIVNRGAEKYQKIEAIESVSYEFSRQKQKSCTLSFGNFLINFLKMLRRKPYFLKSTFFYYPLLKVTDLQQKRYIFFVTVCEREQEQNRHPLIEC